jgi:hypothetical protein
MSLMDIIQRLHQQQGGNVQTTQPVGQPIPAQTPAAPPAPFNYNAPLLPGGPVTGQPFNYNAPVLGANGVPIGGAGGPEHPFLRKLAGMDNKSGFLGILQNIGRKLP